MVDAKPLTSEPPMHSLIVLVVVAVEALNLALLWLALRLRISQVIRPLVAGAGLSGAWGAWVLVLVLHEPASMVALAASVFALSSVTMAIAIHLATVEEEDRQDGGGGVTPTVDHDGSGGGGDEEPPWWPEFQRQLAAYAAQRPMTDAEREHVA